MLLQCKLYDSVLSVNEFILNGKLMTIYVNGINNSKLFAITNENLFFMIITFIEL